MTASTINPAPIRQNLDKAVLFFKRKKYDIVISYCDQVLRMDNANDEAKKLKLDSIVEIIRYYTDKKDYASAMRFCYLGLDIDKLYPALVLEFIDCCLCGEYEISDDYLKEILDNEFNYPPLIEYKAALMSIYNGMDAALEYLDSRIPQNPDIYSLYYAKGYYLYLQKRFEEALPCFDKSIELAEGEKHNLCLLKALTLSAIGKTQEAGKILKGIKIRIKDILNAETTTAEYKEQLPAVYEMVYRDEQSEFNQIVTRRGIIRDLNNSEYRKYVRYFIKKNIYFSKKPFLKDNLIFLLLKFKLFRDGICNLFSKKGEEKQNRFSFKTFCPNLKRYERKIFRFSVVLIFSWMLYLFFVIYLFSTFFLVQYILQESFSSYVKRGNIDLLVLYLSVTLFTIVISSRFFLPAAKDCFNEGYIQDYLKKAKTGKIQRKNIRLYLNFLPGGLTRLYLNHRKVAHFYNKIPKNPVIAGKIEKYRIGKIKKNNNVFRYIQYLIRKLSLNLTIIKLKDFSFNRVQKFTVHFIYFIYFSLISASYIFKYGQFEFVYNYFDKHGIDIVFFDDAVNAVIFSLITFMAYENIRSTRDGPETGKNKPASFYPDGTDSITKK
jgi:tetratricopeptide (TPR) repeat protein